MRKMDVIKNHFLDGPHPVLDSCAVVFVVEIVQIKRGIRNDFNLSFRLLLESFAPMQSCHPAVERTHQHDFLPIQQPPLSVEVVDRFLNNF